ncbi:MAG: TlpA family protein disulfide reductase [Bacteroidales bacterium]|nr:TlpA family protein disulfide reductase [Bacteroidales bacterium]
MKIFRQFIPTILLFLVFFNSQAQEVNPTGKKIWAKSFLNQKAPEIVVDQWVTDEPKLKGKFIIVDFWATWCPPCKRAIPELNKFANDLKKNVVVIGISDEPPAKIQKMLVPKIDYFVASDPQRRMMKEIEVKGIPHVIVIDPHGIVRWEGLPILPNYELTEEKLKALIKKYK